MGNYTLKARCFARIKLFNHISNSIVTVVGHYDKAQKVPPCSPYSSLMLRRLRWRHLQRFATRGGCTTFEER
jgi:hypothetical protein